MRVCQSSSGAVPGVGLTPLQEVAYMLLPLEGGAGTALCVEAEQQVQQSLETHEPRLLLEQLLKPLQPNLGRHSHLVPGSSETSNPPPPRPSSRLPPQHSPSFSGRFLPISAALIL